MKLLLKRFLLFGFAIVISHNVYAQSDVKFSGLLFGDYYYAANNHDEDIEGENAFWIRRIYLTFDKPLSGNFSFRTRLEMGNPGNFNTKSKMEPFIKDGYVRWRKNNHNIYLGISASPFTILLEPLWGYRAVEKTAPDLQKLISTRQFGISFRGYFGASQKVSYHYFLSNGNANSSEVGQGKKSAASLGFHPVKGLTFQAYADYDDRPDGKHRETYMGFTGYGNDDFRIGGLYIRQNRRVGPNTDDLKLDVVSIFGVRKFNEKVSGFARYDRMFDPNPEGDKISYIPFDPTAKSHFILVGIDYNAAPTVKIIPNVEIVKYNENGAGVTPGTDIIPRATLFVTF